ncbi:Lot5 [Kluyveromyces lactis]|nr:Lot5 [Kluyveromyces lactis]
MVIHPSEKQFCQLILTKPTVENVATIGQYQLTQPRLKGINLLEQSDLPILYGGGRDFMFGELNSELEPAENAATNSPSQMILSDLFVLNTCVLIWFQDWERSLQIPYRNIMYHAIRKIDDTHLTEGHRLELMIAIERDPIINELFPLPNVSKANNFAGTGSYLQETTLSSVELILRPKYANFDRHYNVEVEDLFTFKEFGLNRGDTMVKNCHNAILTCMDFYPEEEPTNQQCTQPHSTTTEISAMPDIGHLQNVYVNSGTADDLDGDSTMDIYAQDGFDASMALQFYADQPLAGQKHRV